MATVTTPAGDVLEGVTGSLLDYYRGEGYDIVEDEVEAVHFPVIYDVREVPAKSAPKAEWVEYAEEHGDAAAAEKTKAELQDEFGSD